MIAVNLKVLMLCVAGLSVLIVLFRQIQREGDIAMATESFSRTFTVNPDWGIKNLEKAIDNGSPAVKRLSTPEAKAKFKEATTMTPERAARLKARYGE